MKDRLWRSLGLLSDQRRLAGLAVLLQSATILSGVALMATSAWLISTAALHPSIAALQVAIVGVRFFGIARGLARYCERLVAHDVTLRLLESLRVRVYRAIEPHAPFGLAGLRTGDLLARLVGDVETLEHLFVRVAGPSMASLLVLAVAASLLGARGSEMAAVLIAGFFVTGVVLPLIAWKFGAARSARAVSLHSALQAQVVDVVQGLADTLALGRAGLARREVAGLSRSLGAAQVGAVRIAALGTSLAAVATDLTAVAVLWFAALRVEHGQLAGVQLAVVTLLTLAAFEAVSPLPAAVQASGAVSAASERVFSLERRPRPPGRPVSQTASPPIRRLELRGVRVRYEGQVRPALDGVDLRVEPGRSVAIVGPSGSGKSTLAHLLLRFVEPEEGSVLADDRDVSGIAPEDVRRSIALVPQRVHLFTGTVRDNLHLANPDWQDEAVREALRASGFDRVVASLPDGLDAWLGEQGWQLSGGERQRLALARAFLKPAQVLVLDEPTANLDATSERAVFREIAGRADEQGILLVTHRVASVDWCDEIVVLEHGRVTERGSWAGLSSTNGWFARMLAIERAHRRLDADT